jgi:hypothetical protein
MDEMRIQHQNELTHHQERLNKILITHKEELEKLQKENYDLRNELLKSNFTKHQKPQAGCSHRNPNKHKKQTVKGLDNYREQVEVRKENNDLKSSNFKDTCSLLLKNYKKIRNQNCDLTLQLAGGKTLDVHKTILMGN